jgi:hypothetical protein
MLGWLQYVGRRIWYKHSWLDLMKCKHPQSHYWSSFDGLAPIMGVTLQDVEGLELGFVVVAPAVAVAPARTGGTRQCPVTSAQYSRVTALGAYLVSLTASSDVQDVTLEEAVDFVLAACLPGLVTKQDVLALGKQVYDTVQGRAKARVRRV